MEYAFWREGRGAAELQTLFGKTRTALEDCTKEVAAFGGALPEESRQEAQAAVVEAGPGPRH